MKRLHDLRPADFEQVPVWHYLGESDDVATVRATTRKTLSAGDGELFIARTQFTLAGGAHHTGFCSPARESGLEFMQPVILTADGLVFFYFDAPPSRETLERQWQKLGAYREEIFPVHYRCTIPVDGQFVTGTIEEGDLTGAA